MKLLEADDAQTAGEDDAGQQDGPARRLQPATAPDQIRLTHADIGVFADSGPRVAGLSALGQFIALPSVDNAWHRATA